MIQVFFIKSIFYLSIFLFCVKIIIYVLMKIFAERLKSLREEAGITQIQLAREANLDKSTIVKHERAKISPSAEVLIIFAKFFHVTTDYLLGLEE